MLRKPRRSALVPALVALLVLAAGCGDDDPVHPQPAGFAFSLTVLDVNGAPLPDHGVSRKCRLLTQAAPVPVRGAPLDSSSGYLVFPAIPNPATEYAQATIQVLEVPVARDLTVRVLDWRGDDVLQPIGIPIGDLQRLTVHWSLRDNAGVQVPNGVYAVEFTVTEPDTSLIVVREAVWFSVYAERGPYRNHMGSTDGNGVFRTTDRSYFPPLQGHQPQMGHEIGVGETDLFAFSDTVEVTVTRSSDGGWLHWMTGDLVLREDGVPFVFVFVPEDSVNVFDPPIVEETAVAPPAWLIVE